MTSRPGPGTQEPLHLRGGGPAYAPARRPPNLQLGHLDPPVEGERGPEEAVAKARPRGKILSLEGLQTTHGDVVRQAPRGRPEHFFSYAPPGSNEHHTRGQTITNLPVPPRPGSSVSGDVVQQRRIIPGGSGVKDDLTLRPQAPDTPSQALMFPGGKTADLFPWTGGHPEDVLSEVLVKSGMSNKSQIMNETNTARPSLWSNLKNKSGVSTLSTLFVTILEKRQSSSRFTAPHTFKPPPRLTLRDSTRETWLKDLANPMVRLGRLSRTIPTGVTGKVLLEQCLNKNIPIPRAMWLAKCIGINELRTHKRKGQSGTNNYYVTWVRGWTSAVEQFLESIVAAIGQEEWKPRITYALQLTTQLFKERLLEEDHYLDWVLKSLDASSSERLFFWLLVVSIPDFWSSLISSRRRGKRLAESLLGHAEKFYGLEEAQSVPVLALLENAIIKLVSARPACLLLPRTWKKHGHTLALLAQRKAEAGLTHAVTELNTRNTQLTQSSDAPLSRLKDPLGRLYHLLDSVDYGANFSFDELAFDCMEIISDAEVLISAVMQWASSIYRQGSHRVYLVTRLLRKWSHLGADIYQGIIGYLPTLVADHTKDSTSAFRIIAELLRSNSFHLGRYLQRLIATGFLDQHRDLSSTAAWPLRLMTEMPLTGLSVHVRNLRRTLLRSTAYSVDDEELAIAEMQEVIRYQLPGLFNQGLSSYEHSRVDITFLSQTVRLEIGIWLREQVIASTEYVDCIPTKDPSIVDSGTVCQISVSDFQVVRAYMEQFDDLAIMADIIGIVATSFDSNVLSAAADTLNYHHVAFRAIGAFDPIFEKIATRYAAIRTVRFPERELLHSLIDLSHTAKADPQLIQLLRYDISRYDQKNVLNVCSPVSDNMVEGVAAVDVEDEIERILSSGTSMDQQMMSRIFGKIAKYMEDQLCQGNQHVENFSTWLFRLRCFEESTFDIILSTWLGSLLMTHQQQLLSVVLPPLVASGSLRLDLFLRAVRESIRGRPNMQPGESLQIGVFGLQRILPAQILVGNGQQQDDYRYRLEQYKFCRQHNSGLLDLVQDLSELQFSAGEESCEEQLLEMLCDSRLLDVFRHLAILEGEPLAALVASSPSRSTRTKRILDRLLHPTNPSEFSQMTKEQQITSVVQYADLLSLPFCQLELRQISLMSPLDTEDEADRVSVAMVTAIKTAIDQDQPCWPTLISSLEPGLTYKIREHAEREVISASRFLSGPHLVSAHEHADNKHHLVQKYLNVIDATAFSDTQEAPSGLLVPLVERFKGATDLLSSWENEDPTGGLTVHLDLCYWLHALHRLAVAHGSALVTKASHQHQRVLMWTLRDLIAHPGLERFPITARSLSDLATLLSDSIADDVRRRLVQVDAAKPVDDDHCAFIFGRPSPPDGWLSLTQPTTTPSTGHMGSSQQASNAGAQQYSGQGQPSTGMGSLQRSVSQPLPQQSVQGHSQTRTFSQYSQASKVLPQQLQRMGTNGQTSHSMQQMHSSGPQRNMAAAAVQAQRAGGLNQGPGNGVKTAAAKQELAELRQVPFTVNRWEVLPECGSNSLANETAISLSLFGARKA